MGVGGRGCWENALITVGVILAARRLAWERLTVLRISSHRSNSVGPNRSRGSISRTTR